ncbi:sensor histidine kinase [Microbulbifer spongiae]|uniref:histidine kinase n=1 Tax=Microbulbifer spongiae TaxID=2944933 RepID=A0ABY9EC22_9GAMM|nr:hypothetical protein [Microbulbifer sp. MI-G]WKD50187.1 hypothetical protein M8T91_01785 [Microbulbifer sp. MI-G]
MMLLLPVIFWGLMLAIDNLDGLGDLYKFEQVSWQYSPGDIPSELGSAWQFEKLPRLFKIEKANVNIWFRVQPKNDTCSSLQAIFIPKQKWGIRLFIHDRLIGETPHSSFVLPNWNTPVFLSLPQGECNSIPTLYIQMKLGSRTALLSPFYIATPEKLLPAYRTHQLLNVTIPQISCIILWVFSLLMMVFWVQRRKNSVYGWFSLVVALWASHTTLRLMALPGFMPYWIWSFLLTACVVWFVSIGIVFTHRFIKIKVPILEVGVNTLNVFLSIVAAWLLYIRSDYYHLIAGKIWIGFALLIGIYNLIRLTFSRNLLFQERICLSGCFLLILSVGAHDYAIVNFWVEQSRQYYLHHAGFIFIVVFLILLILRYQRLLLYQYHVKRTFKNLIFKNAQRFRQDKFNLISRERKRIMQNLHDGAIGHLISAVNSLRLGNINPKLIIDLLQHSIDDLRIIIDSLDEDMNDLGLFLICFRQRYEPRLKACGIELMWTNSINERYVLDADKALNILRIIQESITNVIKHSGASKLKFLAEIDYIESTGCPALYLTLSDNGRGFNGQLAGRGINILHERAENLKGSLQIISSKLTGTRVQLMCPLAGC